MGLKLKRNPKKSWARAKAQKIRTVGPCRYCKAEITNDMSFVIFATKEPAHYDCMKVINKQEIVEEKSENPFAILRNIQIADNGKE